MCPTAAMMSRSSIESRPANRENGRVQRTRIGSRRIRHCQ
jgi:hypothetical protein